MGWWPGLARELRPLQLDAHCLPLCPASHGPLSGCHSSGPSSRSPSTEPILGACAGQAGWGLGGGSVDQEDPGNQLSPCPPGSGEGTWGPLVQAGWTQSNNGGPSLPGLVSHHVGGGGTAQLRGYTPMPASLSGRGLGCETRACPALGCPARGPWEPVGARGPGWEAAGSAWSQDRQ